MIVNGVTLPDIPDEAKNKYSHFFIVEHTRTGNVEIDSYNLYCANDAMAYIPGSLMGMDYSYLVNSTPGYTAYTYSKLGDSKWSSGSFGSETDPAHCIIGTVDMGTWEDVTTLIWADHDIKTVTGFDQSTGEFFFGDIYFPNSEAPKPTRVSIGRSLVDGYAREVQRLTGTAEQMNAIQIREKLSTAKAAIKIGDVVLPPIPEDVLDEYPYVVIMESVDNGVNVGSLLLASKNRFSFGNKNLIESAYDTILSYGSGVGYEIMAGANEWSFDSSADGVGFPITKIETMEVRLAWANHDIYIANSYDSVTGALTDSLDLYFSERQNFNGVLLPKVPVGLSSGKSERILFKIYDQDEPNYYLVAFSGECYFASAETLIPMGVPIEGEGALLYTTPDITYWCKDGDVSKWYDGNPGEGMVPIGKFGNYHYEMLWANFDIREVTYFEEGIGNPTFGGIYFPPLPAIDTDRVSIGYDLCNGIVEEVQRLSGEQDKMNALHAYWKLTTVPVIVTGPGEIIINGVKLPPIPAELLAEQPYAVILHDPEDDLPDEYTLYTTKGEIGYLPPSITGSSTYGALVSSEVGHTTYLATPNSTEWTLSKQYNSNYLCGVVPSYRPDWANLDIYEITSLDASTGAYTKGDIWFAKTV